MPLTNAKLGRALGRAYYMLIECTVSRTRENYVHMKQFCGLHKQEGTWEAWSLHLSSPDTCPSGNGIDEPTSFRPCGPCAERVVPDRSGVGVDPRTFE